jgi:hypothetical protein
MKQQNQWLFEPPITLNSSFFNTDITPAGESDRELYEQYRRYNQQFRGEMANLIGNTPNHPLKFLVKKGLGGTVVWRNAKDLRIDAGHVNPVMIMKKLGHRKERLAIQDRKFNRRDGAIMKATGKGKRVKVVMLRGVPIDYDTLKKYISQGYLHRSWIDKVQTHLGWTPQLEQEIHLALGEFHDWISR